MRANGRCKACLRPIRWAKTVTGKAMPLDPSPHDDGNIIVETWRQGQPLIIVYAAPSDVPASEPLRYRSHFVTCPEADSFRRKEAPS